MTSSTCLVLLFVCVVAAAAASAAQVRFAFDPPEASRPTLEDER